MESQLLDDDVQRKLAISELFKSPGWALFEEEINSLMDSDVCFLDTLSRGPIDAQKLSQFNFSLGKARAYKDVLSIKESLSEEVQPEGNSTEEQPSLNFAPAVSKE